MAIKGVALFMLLAANHLPVVAPMPPESGQTPFVLFHAQHPIIVFHGVSARLPKHDRMHKQPPENVQNLEVPIANQPKRPPAVRLRPSNTISVQQYTGFAGAML